MVVAGCAHSEHNAQGAAPCSAASVAKQAAVRLLVEQGQAGDYFTDDGRETDDGRDWLVWIPKREPELPGAALISVRKLDCSAAWLPLK